MAKFHGAGDFPTNWNFRSEGKFGLGTDGFVHCCISFSISFETVCNEYMITAIGIVVAQYNFRFVLLTYFSKDDPQRVNTRYIITNAIRKAL